MIGKGVQDYIQIRAAIIGFRLVAPSSIVYLAASSVKGRFLLSKWIGLYTLLETAFYLFIYVPRHHSMQKAAVHPPSLNYDERQALFKKCKGYLVGHDYPSGWFLTRDLKRENLIQWTLWALFSTDQEDPEWRAEINDYISEMEGLLGRKLEDGYNKEASSMRLTFDPVVTLHRPLVWYLIVGGVDVYTSLSMLARGFKHYATSKWFTAFPPRPLTTLSKSSAVSELSYWFRPHRSTTKLPILFLHGIGIGLWPYLPFFSDLVAQDPDVGILAIELIPISMHMTSPPLDRDTTCLAISRILASLNLPRVVIISHSYGTVITTHIIHSPHLSTHVAATLFIDPIPFLLHLPSVAYNFVYRKPRTANEWELWYFASRDPDISRALSRHFFWTENVLWKEELDGKEVGIVLSGDDQIVDAQEVRKYLTGEEEMSIRWTKDKWEVLFYPGLDHAMVFDSKERRNPILGMVDRFVRLQ